MRDIDNDILTNHLQRMSQIFGAIHTYDSYMTAPKMANCGPQLSTPNDFLLYTGGYATQLYGDFENNMIRIPS